MNKKLLSILISLLFIFIILSLVYVYSYKNYNKIENFIQNRKNKLVENNENRQNLITNGSFANGKNISSFFHSQGSNEIIVYPNSGNTSYVLRQNSNNNNNNNLEETYYCIKLKLKANSTFNLSCLLYSSKNNNLIHKIKFKNINNNSQEYYLQNKKDENNHFGQFNKYYTYFKTPSNNDEETIETFLYLSYNNKKVRDYIYLTNFTLYQEDYNELPITKNLQVYLDAKNTDSFSNNSLIWKDLSNSGNDFQWSSYPSWNQEGFFYFKQDNTNYDLSGPSGYKLQNNDKIKNKNDFTVFLYIKSNTSNIDTKPAENNSVQGYNFIVEESDEFNILNNNDENNINNNLLSESEYDNDNNDNNLKKNTDNHINILEIPGNQKYSIIFKISENYGSIAIKIGDKVLKTTESILSYQNNLFTLSYNNDLLQLYLNGQKILSEKIEKLYFNNNNIKINPQKKFNGIIYSFLYYNTQLKNNEINLLSKFLINQKSLHKTIDKKINISEYMLTYLPHNHNNNDGNISEEQQANSNNSNITNISNSCNNSNNCPEVIYKNNNYYIDIKKGSKIAKELGYYGIRNYGKKRSIAQHIYEENFPKCKLPDILDKKKYKPDLNNCPFIINNNNPCNYYECKNINWNKPNQNYNNKCKQYIDHYCQINNKYDPACFCWKNENWNKQSCKNWRGIFEPPDKCDFNKYSISEHPDYTKYIRKDKIPCWNCNLDIPK